MSGNVTVAEILANLQTRIAFHRDQEALHAGREAYHRDQRAHHAAELEKVTQHFEAFQASAGAAADLAREPLPSRSAEPVEEAAPDPGRKPRISHLVGKVIEGKPDGEPFGAAAVAEEVNRRFGHLMKKPLDPRLASVVLRRLRDARRLHVVREGKAHQETLYAKGGRPAGGTE
jgi:hypothetical protein